MSLFIANLTRQTKFNPVIRYDLRSPNDVEVRVEAFDTTSLTMTRDQYKALREAVGRFTPSAPTPPSPSQPGSDDGWGG